MGPLVIPWCYGIYDLDVVDEARRAHRQGRDVTVLVQSSEDAANIERLMRSCYRQFLVPILVDATQFIGERVLLPLRCHEHREGMSRVLLRNKSQWTFSYGESE